MTSSHDIKSKIRKARAELLMRLPFYAGILFHMKLHESQEDNIPTAAVDEFGNLYYNANYISKLSQSELMFVLAHEASHVGFNHISRAKSRDRKLWNIAIDIVTNFILKEESCMTPPYGIYMPNDSGIITIDKITIDVNNKTSEDVYDELMSQCGPDGKNLKGKDGLKKLEPYCFDKHLESGTQPKNSNEPPLKQDDPTTFWREVVISSKQLSDIRGCVLANRLKCVIDILLQPPKINWRQAIQVFITKGVPTNFTMKCPGRRGRALGIYLPTTIKEKVSLIIGVDCSGSIGYKEILDFISECYNITKFFPSVTLTIVPWSGAVIEDKILKITSKPRFEDFHNLMNLPGGSTVLESFIEWCDQNATPMDSIIIFTDGYVTNKPYRLLRNQPVVVAISSNGDANILEKSFKCVKIEEE